MYLVIKQKHKCSPACLATHANHGGQLKGTHWVCTDAKYAWVIQGKGAGESKPQESEATTHNIQQLLLKYFWGEEGDLQTTLMDRLMSIKDIQ